MRVFVTGGTGFVGSAVVHDLVRTGHSVLGLARSAASASALAAAGAEPVRGSLADADVLRAAASQVDAVIHTAFDNSGVVSFLRNTRIERTALRAIADVLSRGDRPLVVAGGFAPVIAAGPLLTETDPASPNAGPMGRNVERTLNQLADAGVNTSIVRMPVVHGDGDRFTVPHFIALARKHGVSAYVGAGTNRLPAVHNVDAARVFRLAIERGAPRSRYHAVAEEGVRFRDIAEVIGRRLGVPVVSVSPRAARRYFGFYAAYASGDRPASSAITSETLDWRPAGPPLLADLDRPEYFES